MYFKTSQVELYYEKRGSGEPLVLLHGNGESHAIFDKAAELLEKHFTVYAIDSRGHGNSSKVDELHYEDMANDIYEFITGMELSKPVVYGFSDGGIIALLLAIHHPSLLSRIIASGVNTAPNGIKNGWMAIFKAIYFFTRSSEFKLMLTEPDITPEMLASIAVSVTLTGGSRDMIKAEHMRNTAELIPNAQFIMLPGESHSSYVADSEKIAQIILDSTKKTT